MKASLKNTTNELKHINIALFCGGRGSATIIHELLRWPHIHLTLLVNAYDDGLSTGTLRNFITDMLGPSDFRKNLSFLLNPYCQEQYTLKKLLEYRLPVTISTEDTNRFIKFIQKKSSTSFFDPLYTLFNELNEELYDSIRNYLLAFFEYAQSAAEPFNYSDCSMGNLIFAGAYLRQGKSFNEASKKMSQLVSSQALLVNISEGENRILAALKENGEILSHEAHIVGTQSPAQIQKIFFLTQPLTTLDLETLHKKTFSEKTLWLTNREVLPKISAEAVTALNTADIIIYGPGTQHSSLFPSYRIADYYLRKSPALVKALVMNLEPDHDIQNFSAENILHRALEYMGDKENLSSVITHVLLNQSNDSNALKPGILSEIATHKHLQIITEKFEHTYYAKKIHNGKTVVENVLRLWEKNKIGEENSSTIEIFLDIHKRYLALDSLVEEFLEIDWQHHFLQLSLIFNHTPLKTHSLPGFVKISQTSFNNTFPEVNYFADWLLHGKSEYLVSLTGDGEYRFRDIMLGIRLLEQGTFGAVFGSRNQSRKQFKSTLRAAYGERKILGALSFLGAFLTSALFALRFGLTFSDPLTGFRIFKRSRLTHITSLNAVKQASTPIEIAKYLIHHQIEIAELPVNYRIFLGFSDPYWRFRRGIKNLLSIFWSRLK